LTRWRFGSHLVCDGLERNPAGAAVDLLGLHGSVIAIDASRRSSSSPPSQPFSRMSPQTLRPLAIAASRGDRNIAVVADPLNECADDADRVLDVATSDVFAGGDPTHATTFE
jgi:hypothetical protein